MEGGEEEGREGEGGGEGGKGREGGRGGRGRGTGGNIWNIRSPHLKFLATPLGKVVITCNIAST